MHAECTVSPAFRMAVRANAVFCGVSGLLMAVLAGRLAALLGAGAPGLYLGLGIFLMVYAVHLALTSRRDALPRVEAALIIVGDVAWVLGSLAVVAAVELTEPGVALVLATAAVVAGFALWQWWAVGSGTGPEGAV